MGDGFAVQANMMSSPGVWPAMASAFESSAGPLARRLLAALGADGAYFRVHHFARQLGSAFPLLAAIGARTGRIEIGTAGAE